MAAPILVKVHEYRRTIVAVCDSELIGKKFEQDAFQLDVNKEFYEGKEFSETELTDLFEDLVREDATFNIVGERSIAYALKAGLISEEGILRIQGIPHAMRLM